MPEAGLAAVPEAVVAAGEIALTGSAKAAEFFRSLLLAVLCF